MPSGLDTVRIIPLGVSVGRLARHPSVSGFAVTLGSGWVLLDCGEGMQHRVLDSKLRLPCLEAVLISSLQADHVLGLPGLIATLGSQRRQVALPVYGPVGTDELISTIVRLTGARPTFPLEIRELKTGLVRRTESYGITCAELPARVSSFGFRVTVDGRDIGYCPDSRASETAVILAEDVDLLVHEAAFAERAAATARADDRGHATAAQAARVAREAGAKRLLLAHFSPRYSSLTPLLAEAREIFPATEMARDRVPIDFSISSGVFPRSVAAS